MMRDMTSTEWRRFARGSGRSIALAIALIIGVASAATALPDRRDLVGPIDEIPQGYESWALFLVCTPGWVGPAKSKDLADLYRQYRAFGDAIGSENLAVWFWKERTSLGDTKLSEKVDVARSANYCRALGLKPSEGPYVVVTTKYPSLEAFPAERAVYSLGQLPPADLVKLFDKLTDQLLLDQAPEPSRGAPARPPAVPPARSGGLLVALLESTRTSLIGFGCAVKLQVSAGVVNAELRGCSQ
jgi:hypothetical protein